jgi:membrane protease YdiL (CAAX protease family)
MRAITTTAQPPSISPLKRFIIGHPLWVFFGLAFTISWLFLIADALGSYGMIPFRLTLSGPGLLLVLVMSYGPTIAALIVSWATEGRAGLRTLLARVLPWRAGLHWYALALAGPAAFAFATASLQQVLGATIKPLPGPVHQVVLMGLVGSIVRGIINGEELGWRGYALPRLQKRYTALRSSLILGVIWFAFHLPIMFTIGGVGGSQTVGTALPFLVGVLAMSVTITWIFNATRGSVLPIILLHGAYNTWPDLFAMTSGNGALAWVGAAISVLLATIVLVVYGPARLSPKPATVLPIERDDVTS